MKKALSIALILAALLALALLFYRSTAPDPDQGYRRETVTISGHAFGALVADTEALRERGLSYRDGLKPGEVMLFVFDKPDIVGFWMKDMRFSLDMLWLDAHGDIVSWKEGVSPATYPEVFLPSAPSEYVIELPAGTLATLGIRAGDRVGMSTGK